jgi:hypothetical protein
MNLHDCCIQYFPAPLEVLQLHSKASLLTALQIYRWRDINAITVDGRIRTPYQKRQQENILFDLFQHGVITETVDGPQLQPVAESKSNAADRVILPSLCDYTSLSLGAIKVLIACYAHCRNKREHFRFTCTQEQLAKEAQLSERKVRDALKALEDSNLILIEKQWRNGTRITLLDPEMPSGVELYHLGRFYQSRLDEIPIHDRYKMMLEDFDSKGHLRNVKSPVQNYRVVCPYCPHPERKGTLQFDSTDEGDFWTCHKCGKRGNSARLWASLERWKTRKDWRSVIAKAEADTYKRMQGQGQGQEAEISK